MSEVTVSVSISGDITRIQAELDRYKLVIDAMPAMIAYWDKDLRCQLANRIYVDWFGVAPEDLIGREMRNLLGPVLFEKNRPYIERALSGETVVFERELKRRSHEDVRHTQATYIPHFVRNDVQGFFVLVVDITKEKEAELQALKAQAEAEEALRAKTLFLATMSHEIRTPMNGVLGMISLLDETDLNPDQREMLAVIKSSGEGLMRILNDILDFSKLESRNLVIETHSTDLRLLIDDVALLLRPKAEEKGIALSVEIDPATPRFVEVDSFRLKQVLLNLVGNAVKFTLQGGVRILVRASQIDQREFMLQVRVEDTGVGISSADREKLFRAFSQADGGVTRRFGGTGLGLSISRKLVELMNGSIGFESEIGRGSCFTVDVPVLLGKESLSDVPPAIQWDPSWAEFYPLKILIAEDNPVNQLVARKMFRKLGYEVDVASDGLQACQRAREKAYDLVFMDLQMPNLDGFQATRRILSDQQEVAPRIIAMTANAFSEDRGKCVEAGMSDFISKPMTMRSLAEIFLRNL